MSYFELSLDAVNKAYSWGWRISLAAAVSTALGVLLLTWVARVKEHEFADQVTTLLSRAATSEQRAFALEQETAKLRLEFAREDAEREAAVPLAPTQASAAAETEATPAPRAREGPELLARRFTPEQRIALLGRLQRIKHRVNLRFEPNQEAAEYAVAFRDMFTSAGLSVTFASAANPTGLTGIRMAMIMTPGEGEPLPAAKEMSYILQESGLPLERPIHWRSFPLADGEPPVLRSQSVRSPDVLIFIGERPLPR